MKREEIMSDPVSYAEQHPLSHQSTQPFLRYGGFQASHYHFLSLPHNVAPAGHAALEMSRRVIRATLFPFPPRARPYRLFSISDRALVLPRSRAQGRLGMSSPQS